MKIRSIAHHGATATLAVALLVLGACGLAACGDDTPGPDATVTVTATPSGSTGASTDPSAKPSATPTAAKMQSVIAVASGTKANALAVVAPSTKKTVTLVPATAGRITAIAWSPDGTRIAWSQLKSTSSGDAAIWVYDLAKKKVSPVKVAGGTPKSVAGFTWLAPTKVLCAVIVGATSYHTNGQMYVCDVSKETSAQLKDDKGAVVRGIWPTVSANFRVVAYVRYGPPAGGNQPESLMVYDGNTASLTKVAQDKLPTDYDNDAFAYPSISPEGSFISSCRIGSDPGFGLTITGIDGAPVLDKGGLVWPTPGAWDSLSGRLAYGGAKDSKAENGTLWTWDPDTTATKAVYKATKHVIGAAAWSPTGDYLAFGSSPSAGGSTDLWVVGAGGGGAHLVLKNAAAPAWAKAAVPGL